MLLNFYGDSSAKNNNFFIENVNWRVSFLLLMIKNYFL